MVTVLRQYGVDFWAVGALPLGIGLDLALGYFPRKPRPGLAIGRLVEVAERGLRAAIAQRGRTPKAELMAGVILAVVVVGLVGGLAWLAVEVLGQFGGPATLIGRAALIAWGLSSGGLGAGALRASEAPDLATARRVAASFLGIGSGRLDPDGINRACIRGVGERANRRVVAPLFWLGIGGAAGLWSYLAIDTLHAMVADGSPRSRYLGFAAARLDDLANFLPARLTWLLLALSAALMGDDAGAAFRFGLAQGRRHPDRDEVWGRAALDGSLGLQPGGPLDHGPVNPSTVRRAVRIMQIAGLHAAALAIAYRIVVLGD
jgi:adenosylcobinamide-phosphate synthase